MRKLILLAVVGFLAVACASRPQKLAGTYAIVVDPDVRIGWGESLPQSVESALKNRLELTADSANADAVIVLKRAPQPGWLEYEIHRAGALVATGVPGTRTAGRQTATRREYENQRAYEAVRENREPLSPKERLRPPIMEPEASTMTAQRIKATQIADEIVLKLGEL